MDRFEGPEDCEPRAIVNYWNGYEQVTESNCDNCEYRDECEYWN